MEQLTIKNISFLARLDNQIVIRARRNRAVIYMRIFSRFYVVQKKEPDVLKVQTKLARSVH